jgi:hypothetical protein
MVGRIDDDDGWMDGWMVDTQTMQCKRIALYFTLLYSLS